MRAEARFRVMGFPEQDTRRGLGAVDQTLQAVRGVKRADVIETLTALTSTFGDVEQASKFLPIASKYRANMTTLYGDKYGPEEISRQISNTFKSLELLGVDRPTGPGGEFTDKDRARMESYFSRIAQATAATGGDINPAEFRAFAKYGRTAVMGLSPEGLARLLPLVQQLGGSQTGTALMSLSQNLIGGAMPAHKLREWDRLGLVRHKDDKGQPLVEYTKAEEIKRMRPGAIPMADTLLTDPMAFADKMAEKFSSMGIDTKDFNAVNRQLYAMLGNRTSAGALSQMINYRASLDKEAKNYERALAVSETYKELFDRQNPLASFLDAQAKWTDAQARAGRPLTEAAGGAAGSAADWMLRHPDVASFFAGTKALGTASTEAASGVGSLSSALSGIRINVGGGGAGGAGGIMGTGVGTSDIATTGYLGWRALRAGGRVAGPLGVAAASAFTGKEVWDLYNVMEESRGARAAESGAHAGNVRTINRARAEFGARGEQVPREVWAAQARTALTNVNRDNQLRDALQGWSAGSLLKEFAHLNVFAGGPALFPNTNPFSGARRFEPAGWSTARTFRERAPELQVPEVMREFRAALDAWRLPKESRESVDRALRTEFPESFAKATADAAGGLAQLPEPAQRAAEALMNVYDPASRLGGGLGQAQGAAVSFAARVNALDVRSNFSFTLPALPSNAVGGNPLGRAGIQGPPIGRTPFTFTPPSAVGSVVESDGLVNVHRGNVITPARLSRRTPGDWLESAAAIQRAALPPETGERAPYPGQFPPDYFPTPRGMAAPAGEYAGAPDYSLFDVAATPAGGAGVTYSPTYQVSVGSVGDIDAAIAGLERRQAAERERLKAEMMVALNSPRRFNRQLRDAEARRKAVA